VNRIACSLSIWVLLLGFVACDPGMAIREHWPPNSSSPITLTDHTQHPLVGSNWFVPHIRVQNVTDMEVVIRSVELNVGGRTYLNGRGREKSYPFSVKARSTAELPVWFDLREQSVYKLFYEKQGKVLVRYTYKGEDALIEVEVSGGPIRG
jgi:hypothetical protein